MSESVALAGGPVDWRDTEDDDPDDEEIETPPDVVKALGFDPKEMEGRADSVANPLEVKEKLANSRGPDLPEGVTVRRVFYYEDGKEAGEYKPEDKAVHLGRRIRLTETDTRRLAAPDKIAAHECGHAVDHALGWASHDFDEKWLSGLLGMLEPDEMLGARYYLEEPEEAFAEAYALLHGPSDALYFGVMTRLRALAALDPLIDRTRSILLPHSAAAR